VIGRGELQLRPEEATELFPEGGYKLGTAVGDYSRGWTEIFIDMGYIHCGQGLRIDLLVAGDRYGSFAESADEHADHIIAYFVRWHLFEVD
jgi:hypothetical protein